MLLQGYLQGVSTFVSYFLTTTHDGLVEDLAEHQPRTSRLERDAATLDDPGTCMDLLEYVVIRRSTSRSSSLESQNARHCSGSYKQPIWEVRLQRNQLAFWYANVEMIS
jgi:hypothetical protein